MVLSAKRIGVVGAGMMGSEIALVFALAGHDVKLSDAGAERLKAAMSNLTKIVQKGVGRGFWSAEDAGQVFSRIAPTSAIDDFADRDFVIEAVFEDEQVKAGVYRELDRVCNDACIIASNTSSISISVLASHLPAKRRAQFLGAHFFSPVSRMKLVEIIPGLETAQATVEYAASMCATAGKVAVRVKDVAGFAVNRLLHAFLIEAIRLAEEGVATPADIDAACKLGLGHPIGPFEMMDVVSNPLVLQVQEVMAEAYGERFRPPPLLKQMVKAGYGGRKAGRGWLARAPE